MIADLYACCHIADLPVQALLRLRPALRNSCVAVLEGEAPLEKVCSRNARAAHLGIVPGMPRTQLNAFSDVAVLRRSLREEQSAMTALLQCIGAFSPRIEDGSRDGAGTLIADIAGTERLLGAPALVAQAIMRQAEAAGLKATVAISRNMHTALCLSRFGRSTVVESGREREALAGLPLRVAEPSPQHAETLAHWGIRNLGELAALDQEALIARFGQQAKRLHQLAQGCHPHLFRPADPVLALEECMDFEDPVDLLEPLLFVLLPMLDQLLLRARMNALAISRLDLLLTLSGGGEHALTLRPAVPSEDKLFLLKLLHLELQAQPPPAAVMRLRLLAESAALKKVQLGLFSPQLPEPSRLDVTLARLRAIVGDDRVGSPVLEDTHRRDAFHLAPFSADARALNAPGHASATAVRQLRPPEPVSVALQQAVPCQLRFRGERYRISRAYGPWQSSGAWWSTEPWTIEQWDLIAQGETSASLLACRLLHDRADGCWQVDALYD